MGTKLQFKQGEAKSLQISLTSNGEAVDLSGAVLSLGVKRSKADPEYVIFKEDQDFDKSRAAEGVLAVFFSATDLGQAPGYYLAELKVAFEDGTIEKSRDISLIIEEAVT
jgi:hypothetical protein